MKRSKLICMGAMVMLVLGMISCSSDEKSERGGNPDKNGLIIYDKLPFNGETTQGNNDMTPNTQSPYTLFVMPNDEEGKVIIKKMAEEKDVILEGPTPYSDFNIEEGYWITSKNYFESPHLYVSVNYMMKGMESRGYVIHITPIITIKMKKGYDIKTIQEKYNLTYVHTTGNDMWYDYRFNVNNSQQVMALADKIQDEEGVEWVTLCRLGDGWVADSVDGWVESLYYDPTYQVNYYAQDPGLYKRQGYWFEDFFIELTPQKEPPFTLMVKWDNDMGKEALDYILGNGDVKELVRADNVAIIVSDRYILCPYFYVSSSYKSSQDFLYENEYIRIGNRILMKMKSIESVEDIKRDYASVLRFDTDKNIVDNVVAFDCSLRTSWQVLQLAEEIHLRNDVEWAEASMFAPAHKD